MGSPIAAGSVVITRASVAAFELESRRPLLGVCESADAPGSPGDPPTNVIVAWEDGTRVTYVGAGGLYSVVAPSTPSLLGKVVQYGASPFPTLERGSRLRGPVVMHADLVQANGDDGAPDMVIFKTPFGYADFPSLGLAVVPNA